MYLDSSVSFLLLQCLLQIKSKNYKLITICIYIYIYIFSIITQVIIEILALSLAENSVIFRYNHLRRGDYSWRTNFQNNRLALCQCVRRVH